jgi:signal transduction histidine kinase
MASTLPKFGLSSDGLSTLETVTALEAAEARASALAAAAGDNASAAGIGALAYTADTIARLALARDWSAADVKRSVARVAALTGIPESVAGLAVYVQVIRDPRLLALPPWLGIETIGRMLVAFAPVQTAGLWTSDLHEPLTCVLCLGDGPPTRRMENAARAVIEGVSGSSDERSTIHALPVKRWQHCCAALVVRASARDRDRAKTFAREATGALGLLLERAALLDRAAARERSLVGAGERRLTRLGYDIHDGPLQDIGAAVREIRFLRDRAASGAVSAELVLEGLAEIEEMLVSAEGSLRELSHSVEAPAIIGRPFRETIGREAESLSASGDIETDVDLRGDFETLTASQRIALIRIVQEALTNAREHSGADKVKISIIAGPDSVQAEIADNGQGFDVEPTLVAAARRGRLGLVGMSERVRLLGGRFDVQSRRGQSTVVTATLPRWRPLISVRTAGDARS